MPLSITEAASQLRAGTLSSVELIESAYARADRFDSRLGTYLARFDEAAREAAARADAELGAGIDRGPLQGIPIAVKDIIAVSDGPTTAQSLVLDPSWGADKDAPIIQRLKAAGAVITGKATTNEFAIGSPDGTKPFPLPRNPWDTNRWSGGSSAGSGNGVAAGFFLGSIGSDTGASIRTPSAYCGITGLMPTFGLVPKSGCVPLGYSLDRIGPLARTARDCAAILQVIAGYHESDVDCVDRPVVYFSADLGQSLAGVRIGVRRNLTIPTGADPAIRACYDAAISTLVSLGASIVEIELPYYSELIAVMRITVACEGFAYHRNDMQTRWGDYFAATRAFLVSGALVTGADFVQAQRVRRVAQRALAKLYERVDVVLTPTHWNVAPRYLSTDTAVTLPGNPDDPEAFAYRLTPYWNPTGYPVIAFPMGFGEQGLPLSLQLAARPFEEPVLFQVVDAYQQATGWHQMIPSIAEVDGDHNADRSAGEHRQSAPTGHPSASRVADLLAAAGIPATEREVDEFAAAYLGLKEMIELLWQVPEARYESPALGFNSAPDLAAW